MLFIDNRINRYLKRHLCGDTGEKYRGPFLLAGKVTVDGKQAFRNLETSDLKVLLMCMAQYARDYRYARDDLSMFEVIPAKWIYYA